MRKREILEEICRRSKFSRRQVSGLYDTIVDVVREALTEGDEVRLPRLGTFTPSTSTNGHRFVKFRSHKSFRREVQANQIDPKIEERILYGLPLG